MSTPGTNNSNTAIPSPFSGRTLVAMSLLVGACSTLIFWVPVLYPKMLKTGNIFDSIALVFLGSAAIILGVIAAALFVVGCIRWAFVDEWRTMILNLHQQTNHQSDQLKIISDRLLISETAKRITYRDKDRQALREAIEDDLKKGEFDAAMVLITEMSKAYGYISEAEEYRERIGEMREATVAKKIKQSLVEFERLLDQAEWDKATAEAAKIQRLYPDAHQVRDLPKRVKDAWQARKHDLERRLLQSASHDDVEGSMELLRELDRYLTPQEAAPFLEVARGVIGKKRQNLGVQFKLAIQDKEWTQAVAVGEQIIREFPNTKMSDEVRTTIDILRERAAGQRAAERSNSPVG